MKQAIPFSKQTLVTLIAFICFIGIGSAQTFDTVVFGNTTSEANHGLTTYFPPATNITTTYWQNNVPPPSDPSASVPSDVVVGGMGLSARRLLPRTPNGDVYGGQMNFTMVVDPVKQNYFSVKMWGSDPDPSNGYLILDVNGKELGGRHGGGGFDRGRALLLRVRLVREPFFLPHRAPSAGHDQGKTSVTLTVRSLGSIFDYAPIFTYVPQYQAIFSAPSMGLYSAYTHAGSVPDVTGEIQGTAPSVPTPRNLENATTAIANVESNVNSTFTSYLNASGPTLSQSNACFLAECYDAQTNHGASWITYPSGMTSANVGTQIIASLDALVTSYASDSTVATNGWGGALGYGGMGDAIRLAWPLISGSMSTTVAYGGTLGTVSRQTAWSTALRASIDSGRYGRQTIGNQAMDNAWMIYCANRGLLLVNSSNALNESEAQRYILEASGINAWLGNDPATGGTDGLGGRTGPDLWRSALRPQLVHVHVKGNDQGRQ